MSTKALHSLLLRLLSSLCYTSSTASRSPFPSRGRLKKASPSRVILSERMRVEALRSAGGAKPRNKVTKGSSKDYSLPILLLLFATEGRDPSTPLRSAQDDTEKGIPITTHFAIRQNFTCEANFTPSGVPSAPLWVTEPLATDGKPSFTLCSPTTIHYQKVNVNKIVRIFCCFCQEICKNAKYNIKDRYLLFS